MTLSKTALRRLEALEVLATSSRPMLQVSLPLRLNSRANDHRYKHWAPQAATTRAHRVGALLALAAHKHRLRGLLDAGLVVRMVRVGPKELDSHDNLGHALKALTDGVADALGVHDRDTRVSFVPDAEKGPWGARIEFYARGDR